MVSIGIGDRRGIAKGFVQGNVLRLRLVGGKNWLSAYPDVVGNGIDFGSELANDLAVDGDFALNDQSFARPPRADSGGCEYLLETRQIGVGFFCGCVCHSVRIPDNPQK